MSREPVSLRMTLGYIADSLTESQQMLLVGSFMTDRPTESRVLVDGNEKTIRALMGTPVPLVIEEHRRRFLSPLGVAVARHLRTEDGS